MKIIENKDCRVIAVTMQGIIITEYSGVIMQIDQEVIKRAADELGIANTNEVEKLSTQLESALSTCKKADETIKELNSLHDSHEKKIEALRKSNCFLNETLNNKDATIKELRGQIDIDNNVINELTFQRDAVKDSVAQLEKQLSEALAKLEEQQQKYKDMLDKANAIIEENKKSITKYEGNR